MNILNLLAKEALSLLCSIFNEVVLLNVEKLRGGVIC